MEKKKEKAFSISKKQVADLYNELQDNMDFLPWALEHYLIYFPEQKYKISLICESFSVGVKLAHEIKRILDSSPVVVNDEQIGEELIIDSQEAALLETGILTRHFSSREMARCSGVSIFKN